MTRRGEVVTGWVLHEPEADEFGWSGWLYHYPDGTVVTEDGSVVGADDDGEDPGAGPEAADPGWFLVDPAQEGSADARWLYQFADGTVVDDEGEVQAVAPLLHLEALPGEQPQGDHPEPEPAPEPEGEDAAEVPVDVWALEALLEESPRPEEDVEEPVRTEGAPGDAADADVEPEPAPVLAAAAVPAPEGTSRSRRRATLLVAAGLAVALAAVAAALGVLVGRGAETRGGTASQAASRFELPGAVPVDSEYVTSRVRPSGVVVVDHWVRTSKPFSRVVLRVPRQALGESSTVGARQVEVETEAGRRRGPVSLTSGQRAAYAGGPTTTLHVRYLLSGVVRRSLTVSDRALVLTSVDLRIPGTRLPKAVVVTGGRPLAAACTVPGAVTAPRPCGNAEGRGWRVSLEPQERGDQVAAQVDLP